MKPGRVERDFSPRREVLVLSDRCSRLSESSSLKRGRDEICAVYVESSSRRGSVCF